jgi:hypothetical protein
MEGDSTPEHPTVFGVAIPGHRSWLGSRIAIRDPCVVGMTLKEVRGGEDQAVILIALGWSEVSDEQAK